MQVISSKDNETIKYIKKLKEKNIEWLPNTEVTGFKKERAVIKTAISTNGDVEDSGRYPNKGGASFRDASSRSGR